MQQYAKLISTDSIVIAPLTYQLADGSWCTGFNRDVDMMTKEGFKPYKSTPQPSVNPYYQYAKPQYALVKGTIEQSWIVMERDRTRIKIVVNKQNYELSRLYRGQQQEDNFNLWELQPLNIAAFPEEMQHKISLCIKEIILYGNHVWVADEGIAKDRGDETIVVTLAVQKDPDEYNRVATTMIDMVLTSADHELWTYLKTAPVVIEEVATEETPAS